MATGKADLLLPWDEFELIERVFAPLTRDLPGAFALKDDVAALKPQPGCDLVLKCDSTIQGVHFFADDPPGTIAQKALRRALSDVAAKGATPAAYLLAIALPPTTSKSWIENFAQGLGDDQARFCVVLAGGETNRTPGELTITVTAIGWVPTGQLLRRNGAKAGDEVWITGTVGDAAGGLCLLKNEAPLRNIVARDRLVRRFRVPEPRAEFGKALGGIARAAIDVSDGLAADLGHIADLSAARMEIELARMPISPELRELWGSEAERRAVSAGDDYEIAFTAPREAADEIIEAARRTRTRATRIGRVYAGAAEIRLLDSFGRHVCLQRKGYTHF